MKAEDVDAALVEKAARAAYYADPFYRSVFGKMLEPREVLPWDELDLADIQELRANARHALAAVLPEIQAQALRDAADRLHARTDGVNREGTKGWPERHREVYAHAIDEASDALREDAARLTDTTEEPKT